MAAQCVNIKHPDFILLEKELGSALAKSITIQNEYVAPSLDKAITYIKGNKIKQFKQAIAHLRNLKTPTIDEMFKGFNNIVYQRDGQWYVVNGARFGETPTEIAVREVEGPNIKFLEDLNKVFGNIFNLSGKHSIVSGIHIIKGTEPIIAGTAIHTQAEGKDDTMVGYRKAADDSINSMYLNTALQIAEGHIPGPASNPNKTKIPYANRSIARKLTELIDKFKSVTSTSAEAKAEKGKIKKRILELADKTYEQFKEVLKANIRGVMDAWNPDYFNRSKHWYDGANRIAQNFAKTYGVSLESAAASIASMSPQNPWFNNISAADRVQDIMQNHLTIPVTAAIFDNAVALTKQSLSEKDEPFVAVIAAMKQHYTDKSLGDILTLIDVTTGNEQESYKEIAANLLRIIDLNIHGPEVTVVTPEGVPTGMQLGSEGPTRFKWGSAGEIYKAISIFQNSDPVNISSQLGRGSKVRNFYNNIANPNSEAGEVTVDTHAVAVAFFNIVGSFDASAMSVFRPGGHPMYAIIKEAYQDVAKEKNLRPREVQSIAWEAIRLLINDANKKEVGNRDAINNIWEQVQNKKITQDEAIKQILGRFTFDRPDWDRTTNKGGNSVNRTETGVAVQQENRNGPNLRRQSPNTGENTTGVVGTNAGRDLISETSKVKYMTEDGTGNYVFYHYSNQDLSKKGIDPNKTGNNILTSRGEKTLAPAAFYYTEPQLKENGLGDFGHAIKVAKDEVYPFNEDPLKLRPIAEERFRKEHPGIAFDPNKQLAWVSVIASEKGFKMTVADWGGIKGVKTSLRAQSPVMLKGGLSVAPVPGTSNQIKTNKALEYKSNRTNKNIKPAPVVSADQALLSELEKKANEGYKATIAAAQNATEAVDYFIEKAIENPDKFDKEFGKNLTTKLIDLASTEKIASVMNSLKRVAPDSPSIPMLESILEARASEGNYAKIGQEFVTPNKIQGSDNYEKPGISDAKNTFKETQGFTTYDEALKNHGNNKQHNIYVTPKAGSGGVGGDVKKVFRSSAVDKGDIGFHFGTEKAANDRAEALERGDDVKQYEITLKNPLRLRDVGAWADFKDVGDELLKRRVINEDEYDRAMVFAKTQGLSGDEHKVLRQILEDKGYDGIIYKNESEDIGNDSYIVFDKSNIREVQTENTTGLVSRTGEAKKVNPSLEEIGDARTSQKQSLKETPKAGSGGVGGEVYVKYATEIKKLKEIEYDEDAKDDEDANDIELEKQANIVEELGKKIGFTIEWNDSWNGYDILLSQSNLSIKEASDKIVNLARELGMTIEVNSDNTLKVWHETSRKNALSIVKNGFSKDGGDLFFSPTEGGLNSSGQYGDTVVEVAVDPRKMIIRPEGELRVENIKSVKVIKIKEASEHFQYYYEGKGISNADQKWLERKGKNSYSGGELSPIIDNGVLIGGYHYESGSVADGGSAIDYIEFKPEYQGKGNLRKVIEDHATNGTLKFISASDDLLKKLKSIGDISTNKSTDVTTLNLATKKSGKVLAIQFSSHYLIDKIRQGEVSKEAQVFDEYFDKLYNEVNGYDRSIDFMELPFWIAQSENSIKDNLDMYVIREAEEGKNFLSQAGYEKVMMSVMDANLDSVREMVKANPKTQFFLGGYVTDLAGKFKDSPNVTVFDTMEKGIEATGHKAEPGFTYNLFTGTSVIPRLKMSEGCKFRCAFCTVPKTVSVVSKEDVKKQVKAMTVLNSKLVYLDDKTFGQAGNYKDLVEIGDELAKANPNFEGFIIQTTGSVFSKIYKEDPTFFKRARITHVELGVETFNDELLKAIKKPTTEAQIQEDVDIMRKEGIKFIPNIIIGLLGETKQTYEHTLDFLKKNADVISHVNIYNLAVYEGTALDEKMNVQAEGDRNENTIEKSFHTNPNLHREYYFKFFELASKLMDKSAGPIAAQSSSTEIVGTEKAFPISELNKIPKGGTNQQLYKPEYYAKLKDSIKNEGVKEPIILKYYVKDNALRLVDGHHRLQIANEVGLKTVPVKVNVVWGSSISEGNEDIKGQPLYHPPIPLDVAGYNKRNYAPSNVQLSELGYKEAATAHTIDQNQQDYDYEVATAKEIIAGTKALEQTDYIEDYIKTVDKEAEFIKGRVVFVGSGALPITPILIANKGFPVVGIDISEEATALGKKVVAKLKNKANLVTRDGTTFDYSMANTVIIALEAGTTLEIKKAILAQITKTAKPSATIIIRSSEGIGGRGEFVNSKELINSVIDVQHTIPIFGGQSTSFIGTKAGVLQIAPYNSTAILKSMMPFTERSKAKDFAKIDEFVKAILPIELYNKYKALYDLGAKHNIIVDVQPGILRTASYGNAMALASWGMGSINIDPSVIFTSIASWEELTEILNHEIIHGLIGKGLAVSMDGEYNLYRNLIPVLNAVADNFNKAPERVQEIISTILDSTHEYQPAINWRAKEDKAGNRPQVENLEELITYAFTNKEFADFLDTIPSIGIAEKAAKISLWQHLKNLIRDFIKAITPKSALDDINSILDDFFHIPVEETIQAAPVADTNVKVNVDEQVLADMTKGNQGDTTTDDTNVWKPVDDAPNFQKNNERVWSHEQKKRFALDNVIRLLKTKFGIKVTVVNEPGSFWRGKYIKGIITINEAYVDPDTPFHEVLHPFIDMLKKENPELFNSLMTDLKNSETGKKAFEQTQQRYPELSEDDQWIETLVDQLGYMSATQHLENLTDKTLFGKFIDWLKTMLAKMGIMTQSFKTNMSLEEFSNLIVNPSFVFDLSSKIQFENHDERYSKLSNTFDEVINRVRQKLHADTSSRTKNMSEETSKRKYFSGKTAEALSADPRDLKAIDNFIMSSVSNLKKLNENFEAFKQLFDAKKDKSPADLIELGNLLNEIEDNITLYEDVDLLISAVMDEFPDAEDTIGNLKKNYSKEAKLINDYKSYARELIVNWLFPHAKSAINKALATGKPFSVVSKAMYEAVQKELIAENITDKRSILETAFKRELASYITTAKKDASAVTQFLGPLLHSRDPLSALIARAVVEEYTSALTKGLHIQERLGKLVRQARGLQLVNTNKDHFNFYGKYLRQATSYEYAGMNDKGEHTYKEVKRWAFHEEYKWDEFYKAKREMEKAIGVAPSKNDVAKWTAWKAKQEAWYALNTVKTTVNGKDARIPASQYKNAEFAALQSDKLFVGLYTAYKDANIKVGKQGLKYGIIPQDRTVNLKFEKGKLAKTAIEKLRLFIGEDDQVYFNQKNNLKEKRSVPVGLTRLLDENDLSFDLLNSVAKYAVSSEKYNSISNIEPHVNILKNFIGGNASLGIDPRQVVKVSASGIKALSKSERQAMQVEATKINAQLDSFLNDVIYGQPMKKATVQMFNSKFKVVDKNGNIETIKGFDNLTEFLDIHDLDYGGFEVGKERIVKDHKVTMTRRDWNWSVKKGASTLGLITAFQQLALNPVAGAINVLRAKLETFIEGVGGRYFNIANALEAEGIYFRALGSGDFFEDLKGGKPSFLSDMMIQYDAIQGELYSEAGKKIPGSLANTLFRRNHLFFMQQGGEHWVQTQLMVAMMLHQKVKTNGGEEISLYEAKKREFNGSLKMSDTNWSDINDADFRQSVKFVNTNMHGNYNKLDKAYMQRTWWGSLLMMFRKHIYTGFASRYRKGYVNFQTGNYTEGYYRTFMNGLITQVRSIAENKRMAKMSDDEKYAFRKMAADFGALALLIFAFKAFDDDDDDEEFTDVMALISRRLVSEAVQYTPVIGTMDLAKIVTNPAASVSTVDKVWSALLQSISDPTAEYERSGPGYQAGQNKAAVKWGRAIPVYRQYINAVEPERLLQFYGKNSIWFLKPNAGKESNE